MSIQLDSEKESEQQFGFDYFINFSREKLLSMPFSPSFSLRSVPELPVSVESARRLSLHRTQPAFWVACSKMCSPENVLNANPEANAHKRSIKLFLVFVVVAPSRSRCYQMHKMGIANKQILRRLEIVKHGEWSIKHAKFPPIGYKTSCMG